ncbi:MAG: protein-(glutamine-N5) methyltransferase, release factor-specific [Bacteroidetes bacterium GWA2_31_9]|nr:MAG: protein-(glutamine-N5) methyltransferase, release factor-specific [Bacteroidetes bacterium GWA2_31_9]
MTFKNLKNNFIKTLKHLYAEHECESIFYILAEHVFKSTKSEIHLNFNNNIPIEKLLDFNNCLSELKQSKPIQYVIGESSFFDLNFIVNENVLIPRQETEELVNLIINDKLNSKSRLKILDIGTGSGCIAISLSTNISKAEVFACDISEKALEVAKNNAVRNNCNVSFFKLDIANCENYKVNEKFDIIVSNPPYVIKYQTSAMQKNVLDYEPHIALFAPDDSPLFFYDKILQFAEKYLVSGGWIYFEINEIYHSQIEELISKFNYKNIEIVKDINDKFRMAKAQKNG